MGESEKRALTDADIIRLGKEAGQTALILPDLPSQEETDERVDELGMRAVELAFTQSIVPEDVDDSV